MTVMWRYFEKDRYHPAWVKFTITSIPRNDSDIRCDLKSALGQYHGTLAGWEVMFESEEDLTFFLLRWS